jgi:nucleoside-diphosphate-sugar epimerase
MVAERYNRAEPVNLGSSFEISIKALVETIARLTGFEGEIRWDILVKAKNFQNNSND